MLFSPIKKWLRGEPFYHMWYCYMIIGVYLMVPFIIEFKARVGEKNFEKIVGGFVLCACLSVWTSTYKLNWNIGLSFCYLGYFMLGYILRKRLINNKSNIRGCLLIVLGIIVELITAYFRYLQALEKIIDTELEFELLSPYSPLIVVASILIFSGFSLIQLNINLSRLATISFYIYLIHAGVWDILDRAVKKIIGINGDSRIVIPVSIIAVFLISYILALVYINFWNRLEKKFCLTDKLCLLLKI